MQTIRITIKSGNLTNVVVTERKSEKDKKERKRSLQKRLEELLRLTNKRDKFRQAKGMKNNVIEGKNKVGIRM